jgi:hypothetical protein
MAIGEEDSGWVPKPQVSPPPQMQVLPADEPVTFDDLEPGLVRLIFFVDADSDSLFTLLPAAAEDSFRWYFEPHALVDSLVVEPGLESPFQFPQFPDTLTPWVPEAPADLASPDTAQVSAP